MMNKQNFSLYLAELIGTFFMVFFGCGSMILAELNPDYSGGFIPVIWGGVVSIMIYSVGHLSGAHFNPAVTISFWIAKKISFQRVGFYILFQVIGALLASLSHFIIWGGEHSFGATSFESNIGLAIFVEFLLSFILMFVITSVATDSRAVGEFAGIAIGSTVGLCAFVGGPLTKASMNPARSIAPAIFSGELTQLWIYIITPVIGAIMGALVYQFISCPSNPSEDTHGCC